MIISKTCIKKTFVQNQGYSIYSADVIYDVYSALFNSNPFINKNKS